MTKTKPAPKPKTINVDLSPETHHRLRVACAVKDLTFSEAVEAALRAWTSNVSFEAAVKGVRS